MIGGWTTASLRQAQLLDPTPKAGHQTAEKAGGARTQVSRLGMPLVNEVVIGLKDKEQRQAQGRCPVRHLRDEPVAAKLLEIALALPGTARPRPTTRAGRNALHKLPRSPVCATQRRRVVERLPQPIGSAEERRQRHEARERCVGSLRNRPLALQLARDAIGRAPAP